MYTEFIDELIARGRFCFTLDDIEKLTSSSPEAIKIALYRLQKKGELIMPYRGFYVILPPEHRSRGCLPPEQFIPDLMEYLGETYYVGLLSAAEYYGAAHQRPQVFQVIVAKSRRPISCGKVRVIFIFRKNAASIPTQPRNTPAGSIKIATPEATALDLIGYVKHCAGLDNVATVLTELSEKIDVKRLTEVAELSPIAWVQRLGYLFELIGEQEKATVLADYLMEKHPSPTALIPMISIKGSKKNNRWQIFVNADVESEV
jgi:predicted transcriptional regulator of viral defense system